MTMTYKDALEKYGSRYRLRKALSEGRVIRRSRGLYAQADDPESPLADIAARYPGAILTGATALYLHGLVDMPPETIDAATATGTTKMVVPGIRQTFVRPDALGVGRTEMEADGARVAVYDKERMLLELMRTRNKLPYDLYREAVRSYRREATYLDIYKLQDYAEAIPRGNAYLNPAMEEVF